jgi:hypothetical protein
MGQKGGEELKIASRDLCDILETRDIFLSNFKHKRRYS